MDEEKKEEPQQKQEVEQSSAAPGQPVGGAVKSPALVLVAALCAGILALLILYGIAWKTVSSKMQSIVQDAPLDFTAPEYAEAQIISINEQIDKAKREASSVTLDASSLSALMTHYLRSGGSDEAKAMVELIQPARIKVKASQPADDGGEKWLNIEATAHLEPSQNGVTVVYESVKTGDVVLSKWMGLETKGEAGKAQPGALIEMLLPEGLTSAEIILEGGLKISFARPAEDAQKQPVQ